MPQINTPTIRHLAPGPYAGWQWLPFHDAIYRACILHALEIIGGRLTGPGRCSAAFRLLPSGRSFADVFGDRAIWISYDPGNLAGRFGASLQDEVTISQYACRMGMRVVAATLIRELARAGGLDCLPAATEQTLLRCLLQRHYDPVLACRLSQEPRELAVSARSPTLRGWS
jgi:hypothetical protein